jgi:CRP/FNR family transcriptional regulator, cyclic AMP receptor protein
VARTSPPPSFCSALSAEALEDLHSIALRRQYRRGEALFREGDDGGMVLVLVVGQAKVLTSSSSGKEVIIALCDPGAILGEIAALDGGPRSATVVAINDVEALSIRHPDFMDFLARHPHAARTLLEILSGKLRDSTIRQLEFGTGDALGRICAMLVDLADRYGSDTPDGRVLELAFSQQELASLAGLSREAVVKGLSALRTLDLIRTDGRSLTLLDEEAVRLRAHAG